MSDASEVLCSTYAPVIGYSEHELWAEVLFRGLGRSAEKDEKEDAPSIVIPRCHGSFGIFHNDYTLWEQSPNSVRSILWLCKDEFDDDDDDESLVVAPCVS